MERGGLNRMNKETGIFTRFMHDPHNPNSLINNKVRAFFEDSKGTLWVGTAGDGLHTMDRGKGTFVRHLYDPAHPEKLSRPAISKEFPQTDHITFIREDAAGAIWIGTSESGINHYNPKTDKTTHYESNKDADGAFTDRTAWGAYSSRDGVLWISTLFGNLYRIDPLRKEIPHFTTPGGNVNCFYEEPNGILWLGTDHGIIRRDINNGIISRDKVGINLSAVSGNWTAFIKEDRQGVMWIGGGGGLTRLETKKGEITTYKNDPKNKSSLSNNGVITIQEDKEGNLWVGTFMGLNFLDRKTGSFTRYFLNPADTTLYGDNFITSILVWTSNSATFLLNGIVPIF